MRKAFAERQRRASPGYTYEPCDLCHSDGRDGNNGEPRQREKGKVCHACEKQLEIAKALIAHNKKMAKDKGAATYRWSTAKWGWTCFYEATARLHDDDAHDKLSDAFWDLVTAVTDPLPESSQWSDEQYLIPKRPGRDYDWRCVVTVNPLIRDYLVELHGSIIKALDVAYEEGHEKGAGLLQQLAKGEISTVEFEEETGKRERKRR